MKKNKYTLLLLVGIGGLLLFLWKPSPQDSPSISTVETVKKMTEEPPPREVSVEEALADPSATTDEWEKDPIKEEPPEKKFKIGDWVFPVVFEDGDYSEELKALIIEDIHLVYSHLNIKILDNRDDVYFSIHILLCSLNPIIHT